MKQIDAYLTGDQEIFTNYLKAKKHAESRYGEALLKMAHKLVVIDKYTTMAEFLNGNIEEFLIIEKLKRDCLLEPNPNDEKI